MHERSGAELRACTQPDRRRGCVQQAHRDVEEQELARKEWLDYYLKVGDWAQAEELVVTRAEQEDLAYLRARA